MKRRYYEIDLCSYFWSYVKASVKIYYVSLYAKKHLSISSIAYGSALVLQSLDMLQIGCMLVNFQTARIRVMVSDRHNFQPLSLSLSEDLFKGLMAVRVN